MKRSFLATSPMLSEESDATGPQAQTSGSPRSLSILDPLYTWAERCPDQRLYAWLNLEGRIIQSFSYREFVARTGGIAAHIVQRCPMAVGERVLLVYPPGLEVICAFFACVRLGLVPVPVYPATRNDFESALAKMAYIARDCEASAVLTDRSYSRSMKIHRARQWAKTLRWSSDALARLPWLVTTNAGPTTRAPKLDRHSELLFLQYTSGSTADPKGVMVTHANVLANCDGVVDHRPVGVSWLPQYHDMGLIGYYLFFALKGGTTYGFSPVDFIRRPALWLEAISTFRATASSAPNFAFDYCLRPGKIPSETLDQLDLSSLRFLMNAAEPVRPHVFRSFVQTFEPFGLDPQAVFSAYGLAENTLAVSNYGRRITDFDRIALQDRRVQRHNAGTGDAEKVSLVSCGQSLAAIEWAIVDTHERPHRVSPGHVGEIWLRGPSTCAGYWNRPELTKSRFEAKLEGEPESEPGSGSGWLRTGDLGFIDEQELFVCGRVDDLIIVRGQNYFPQDIELVVEQGPGVRKGCVAAFAHNRDGVLDIVVIAEVRDPRQIPDTENLRSLVRRTVGVTVHQFVFIRARSMSKTSSGKLVRYQARSEFLDGALDVVHASASANRAEPGLVTYGHHGHHADGAEWEALFGRFGLTGHEAGPVSETGLDSIELVEFVHALSEQLEYSGYARLAEALSLPVVQALPACQLLERLNQLAPNDPLAIASVLASFQSCSAQHRERELVCMHHDARLGFDPDKLTRDLEVGASALENPAGPGTVLLTGGTGFLGPFLLTSLLTQSDDHVIVLVRSRSEAEALERIFRGLGELHPRVPSSWTSRIRAIPGDLECEDLGLSPGDWRHLAQSVDSIVHNGAAVNYIHDYSTLREANVGGTNEILRLAMSHRPKTFNHISTTFVFGWSVKDTLFEHDQNLDMELLDFGYSQSKWVSERIVHQAMERGLQARIFRPALITPSVTGGGSHFDISVRLLAFMLEHALGTTPDNQVSFCPADVVADNIVAIARMPESLGYTFHVTRDDYASMRDITTIMAEHTGVNFQQYALKDFVPQVIRRCRPGDILFPLLEFFVRSTDNIAAMQFKRYDNANYRKFRDASPQGRLDPPLREVVLGLLRFMRRKGLTQV